MSSDVNARCSVTLPRLGKGLRTLKPFCRRSRSCFRQAAIASAPWDFATFDQAIARVHRITSKRPVDAFVAQTVCREDTNDFRMGASLDQKMRALLRDKGDSASLALDGVLPERCETTINIQALVDYLAKHWQKPTDTPDEDDLRRCLLADQFPLHPEP